MLGAHRHRGQPKLHPCHTTRHAGPHRAVREVEVMRNGVPPRRRNTQLSRPCAQPSGCCTTSDEGYLLLSAQHPLMLQAP
jgi:hypothetical protein